MLDELRYPHLSSVKNIFIRGSVVRYVHLPAGEVDRGLLEDASRRGESVSVFLLPLLEAKGKERKLGGEGEEEERGIFFGGSELRGERLLIHACLHYRSGESGWESKMR